MTTQQSNQDETATSSRLQTPRPSRRASWRRRGLLAGLTLMVGAGALSLSVAQAHGFGGDGEGPHGGAFAGGPGGGGFMGFRIQRMLDRVGASDSQKGQVKAIWEGLRPQLKATHEQHEQLHQQIMQAMTGATIDAAQIEKLRQQSVQLVDKTSRLITQGMVSSAQVLTPEQRKQVAAEMQKMHEHHQHHGGPGGEGR